MSTAELTARNFYDTYHLESMPEDVKMHLIVLLSKNSVGEEIPPMLSADDIKARMDSIEADIKTGNTRPIDEFFEEAESNYPWLNNYTSDELKERIEVGEQEEEQGILTAHENVMSNLRKRIAL